MTSSDKTRNLFLYYGKLWGLYLLFGLLLGVLSAFFPDLLSEKYQQNFLQTLLEENPFQLFIMATVFAPIIEEMMFRTLILPKHSDLLLFICAWPLFYVNRFLPVDAHWGIKLGFIAVCLVVLYYLLAQVIREEHTQKWRNWLSKHYQFVLTLSALLFGLVHINNYVEEFVINAALILLIVPRILAGFMMGLIKIKNKGIQWSMALHALNNGVAIGILIWAN
ncbi:MAG: CPBP family intramembrane glutamic endopeptidase [Dokdonia sp.]|jgi:membrane protease YdiL (CAAX protease family)